MANYYYYLGPAYWYSTDAPPVRPMFGPPPGANAMLDLRSLVEMAPGDHRPTVVTWAAAPIADANYHLLGQGDCRTLQPTGADRSAWASLTGYSPQGSTLAEWMFDHLESGADPAGQNAAMPLVPTSQGALELCLAGHSKVKTRPFLGQGDPHWNKLRDLLRRNVREAERVARETRQEMRRLAVAERAAGRHDSADKLERGADDLIGKERRYMGALMQKYRLTDPKELHPSWQPLPPATRRDESWPTNSAITTGQDLGWVNCDLPAAILSASGGTLYQSSASDNYGFGKCSSALSSDDHRVGQTLVTKNSNYSVGVWSRASQYDDVGPYSYVARGYMWQFNCGGWYTRLSKFDGVTETVLSTQTPTIASGDTQKLESDGSSHTFYHNATSYSHTDTTYSGELNCGVTKLTDDTLTTSNPTDSWYAEDLYATGCPKQTRHLQEQGIC